MDNNNINTNDTINNMDNNNNNTNDTINNNITIIPNNINNTNNIINQDNSQTPNNLINQEINEINIQENKRFLGIRLPKISNLKWFNKKPKLRNEPEVIELEPPRENEDNSTSNRSVDVDVENVEQEVSQEQNSLVFDTHIAVLYDRYLNFKERLSNKIRNKIMAFMQDDLENRVNQDEMDIEGGYSDVPTDSTYDGLVLILTIILGFVLRLPSMWILGCILFSLYGNYKKKILKWGFINIGLTVISMCYVVYMWNYNDPDLFSIKLPLRSVLLSRSHYIKGEEGTLKYQGIDSLLVEIEGNKDLKWSLIHKDKKHNMKHGNFSDKLLIDSKLIPKGTDMIRLNNEFVIKGLVLISVKFKTKHLTPKQLYEKPKSHHYPLHHKPSDKPYDLSFECYPIDSNELMIFGDHHNNNTNINNIGNTENNLQDLNDEHLPIPVNNDNKNETISKLNEEDNNIYNLNYYNNKYNLNNNNINKYNDENNMIYQGNENKENEEILIVGDDNNIKKIGEKMYIGVDAIINEENITRIFNLRKLCKCSLVYIPKKDMDVITASIKRID